MRCCTPERTLKPLVTTTACAKMSLLGKMQLKEPDVLGSRRVRRAAQERCQLLAAADVSLLGARCEIAQAHVLDHALAQWGDGRGAHRELLA
jgi:hypothetical protein